jgi:hypothetical protein
MTVSVSTCTLTVFRQDPLKTSTFRLRGVAVLAMGAGLNTRDGYSGGNLDGDLDEIRIYSAALTAAQVKSVMQE